MSRPIGLSFGKRRSSKPEKPEWSKNTREAASNHDLAVQALRSGVCLVFRYHNCDRVVGVFTVGTTRAGRPAMSAWQVDGQSNEIAIPDWGTFCFDECFNVALSDRPMPSPPSTYRRGAKQFGRIDVEV